MSLFTPNPAKLADIARFAALHLDSRDIDPVYPVLKRALQVHADYEDMILWASLLYVAYYHLPSGLYAWEVIWQSCPCGPPVATWFAPPTLLRFAGRLSGLPTGTERRGHRGGRVMGHLYALAGAMDTFNGSPRKWLRQGFTRDPRHNWRRVQETLLAVHGNGRWAAYKTAEVLQKVHDWPLEPTDMGNQYSSGPRHGLALLYPNVEGNGADAIKILDAQGEDLRQRLIDLTGRPMDIAQVETILCDFHSLAQGNYYVGHDIDLMQQQIETFPYWSPQAKTMLWHDRADALPRAYLGECNGWLGVDAKRKKRYQQQGVILGR